jgi:hypothetical protein
LPVLLACAVCLAPALVNSTEQIETARPCFHGGPAIMARLKPLQQPGGLAVAAGSYMRDRGRIPTGRRATGAIR